MDEDKRPLPFTDVSSNLFSIQSFFPNEVENIVLDLESNSEILADIVE